MTLEGIIGKVKRFFKRDAEPFDFWPDQAPVIEVLDNVPKPVMPMLPAPKVVEEHYPINEFYFKEAILDSLDKCFWCMKRLKKFDPDSYDYFRHVGIGIVPKTALIGTRELSPWFCKVRPSRGGTFIENKNTKDIMYPRFIYFHKYDAAKAPPYIQRVKKGGGDIYEVTIFIDERNDDFFRFGGYGQTYAMLVDVDGNVHMLREHIARRNLVRVKYNRQGKKRGEMLSIPERKWGYSSFLKSWSEDECGHPRWKGDFHALALDLFLGAAGHYENVNSGLLRVAVNKDGISVPFSVNVKRTPYFFKDRNVVLTDKGKKARIFHIVRPHVRVNGAAVHMHFRGLRQFLWNGYDVLITVPGKHHTHVSEMDIAGEFVEDGEETGKMITSKRLGQHLAHHIKTGEFDI